MSWVTNMEGGSVRVKIAEGADDSQFASEKGAVEASDNGGGVIAAAEFSQGSKDGRVSDEPDGLSGKAKVDHPQSLPLPPALEPASSSEYKPPKLPPLFFPYPSPYPTQTTLMDLLTSSIIRNRRNDSSEKDVEYLILESPTGTGKSLSLFCGSIRGIRAEPDYSEEQKDDVSAAAEDLKPEDDDPFGWLNDAPSTSKTEEKSKLEVGKPSGAHSTKELDDLNNVLNSTLQSARGAANRRFNARQMRNASSRISNGGGDTDDDDDDDDGDAGSWRHRSLAKWENHFDRVLEDLDSLGEVVREGFFSSSSWKNNGSSVRKKSSPQPETSTTSNKHEEDEFDLLEYDNETMGDSSMPTSLNSNNKRIRRYESSSSESSSDERDGTEDECAKPLAHKVEGANAQTILQEFKKYRNRATKAKNGFESDEDDVAAKKRRRISGIQNVEALPPAPLRIIYAARTHSQLTQFVKEVRSTHWGGVKKSSTSDDTTSDVDISPVRLVTIGSRTNGGCQNEKVLFGTTSKKKQKYKRSEEVVRESCLKLLEDGKSGKKKDDEGGSGCKGCPYIKNNDIRSLNPLSLGILASPLPLSRDDNDEDDVGDSLKFDSDDEIGGVERDGGNVDKTPSVSQLAKSVKLCGYYSAKAAVPGAEVVVTSYQNLFGGGSYFSDEMFESGFASKKKKKLNRAQIKLKTKQNMTKGDVFPPPPLPKGTILILDEAHNLPSTITSLATLVLTLEGAEVALEDIKGYISEYGGRMGGGNLHWVNLLVRFIEMLVNFLKHFKVENTEDLVGSTAGSSKEGEGQGKSSFGKAKGDTKSYTATQFTFASKMDQINPFKLLRYMTGQSHIEGKVMGVRNRKLMKAYTVKVKANGGNGEGIDVPNMQTTPSLSVIRKVLLRLCCNRENSGPSNGSGDFRIIVSKSERTTTMTITPLDPSRLFLPLTKDCHTVVLAGGTMRPFEGIVGELFGYSSGGGSSNKDDRDSNITNSFSIARQADVAIGDWFSNSENTISKSITYPPLAEKEKQERKQSRIRFFSSSHVIAPSNRHVTIIPSGPTSTPLTFTYKMRSLDTTITELGRTLINLMRVCGRGGVVIFFGSYEYEKLCVKKWREKPQGDKTKKSILDVMGGIKTIFREPSKSSELSAVLRRFSSQATRNEGSPGATLFAVVGGKVSEGINFKDDVGRMVVVVGLPYPDISDPVLKVKMKDLDSIRSSNDKSSSGNNSTSSISSQAFYRNMCMRAVNQSVGRAIRHQNDYASIVLIDRRYKEDRMVLAGLPGWLGVKPVDAIRKQFNFGGEISALRDFYRSLQE